MLKSRREMGFFTGFRQPNCRSLQRKDYLGFVAVMDEFVTDVGVGQPQVW
ncbi:MAG: hypothetical protein ACNYPE_07270 [Candidatus Azotimanducaceae bacterium WSBS_2022_MAG_OTU7]